MTVVLCSVGTAIALALEECHRCDAAGICRVCKDALTEENRRTVYDWLCRACHDTANEEAIADGGEPIVMRSPEEQRAARDRFKAILPKRERF